MSVLEERLYEWIAEELRIPRDQITLELIQRVRDERPDLAFSFVTKYGGLNPRRNMAASRAELDENRRQAAAFWRARPPAHSGR